MQTSRTDLELYYNNKNIPELNKTVFSSLEFKKSITGYRTHGVVPKGISGFKWTPCTKALALFFTNAKILIPQFGESTPLLTGNRQSPAHSLSARLWKRDYAWIHDIFGTHTDGSPYMRQLILGINIRQKIQAPTQLFLQTKILKVENIKIFIENKEVTNNLTILKRISAQLTNSWQPYSNTVQPYQPFNKLSSNSNEFINLF